MVSVFSKTIVTFSGLFVLPFHCYVNFLCLKESDVFLENDYHKNNENVQYIMQARGFLIRSGMSFQVDYFLRARAPGEADYVFRMYVLKGGRTKSGESSVKLANI